MESSSQSETSPLEQRLREELGGELEVVRMLGTHKRSHSFLANETGLGRLVVLKVLAPDQSGDDTARARFEREAKAVAKLSHHPNIVQIHRFGVLSDGTPYIVRQYIKGRSIEEILAGRGPYSEKDARQILQDVASALKSAHKAGIVHRDVRPGTVIVEEDTGRALLTDFGIAGVLETASPGAQRITMTGQILGMPEYVSPEQIKGEPPVARTDMYGLGILGYELLANRGPYDTKTKQELLAAHLTQQPRKLQELAMGVSHELADLLQRCLAKEAKHRPTAEDVLAVLTPQKEIAGAQAAGGSGVLARLKQRKLVQWLIGAGAVGFGVIQVVDIGTQQGVLPQVTFTLALPLVGAALLATGVVAWFHGERGTQKIPALEVWLLGIIATAWLATSVVILIQ